MTKIRLENADMETLASCEKFDTPELEETKALMSQVLGHGHSSDFLAGVTSAFFAIADFAALETEPVGRGAERAIRPGVFLEDAADGLERCPAGGRRRAHRGGGATAAGGPWPRR